MFLHLFESKGSKALFCTELIGQKKIKSEILQKIWSESDSAFKKLGVKGLIKSLFFKIVQFAHTTKIHYMNLVMEN